MSFKDVWGFDPNEAIRTQSLFRHDSNRDESMYNEDEQRAARIPVDDKYVSFAECFDPEHGPVRSGSFNYVVAGM